MASDNAIIRLFEERDERAIGETSAKYGRYCSSISYRILSDHGQSEECVNDTYLATWNSVPPTKPKSLQAFLAKICRNLSLKRLRGNVAAKRGGGRVDESLDELAEVVGSADNAVWDEVEAAALAAEIDSFLAGQGEDARKMFVRRYFFFDSIEEIADRFGFSQSKVKMSLKRTRDALESHLREKELLP